MNSNFHFSFVILHYQNVEDTIICIESILKNVKYENFNIIVVDNNSPNKSGKVLFNDYGNDKKIKVILNDENLAFAKGNNVGFTYAKNHFKSDFILLLNNDTYINQSNFISLIIQKYSELKFHIMGPDIISTIDGTHQNPRILTLQNKERLKKYIKLYSFLLVLNYLLLDKILENTKKKIIKKPFITPEKNEKLDWGLEKQDVKLHGSALIFSPLYVSKYDGLNPETFMYSEEAILYFIAM
ncbi:MAG: glycosyltransferase family 2 protein, partial [Ignavibacteriae bacterium]|nr:glycosyltransferase family 2 protein [Ignavibacteriota bacterium]